METFSALLAICAGNSPVSGEFPAQRPVTRSFDIFFDVRLIKRLSKHSRGWWFETLSHPLWRHRNDTTKRELCAHCLELIIVNKESWTATGMLMDTTYWAMIQMVALLHYEYIFLKKSFVLWLKCQFSLFLEI